MTRGDCWKVAYRGTRHLPSFLRQRELDRVFRYLVRAHRAGPSLPRTPAAPAPTGTIVGGVWFAGAAK